MSKIIKFPLSIFAASTILLSANAVFAGNQNVEQPLQQSAIVWPSEYLPGTTDNFVTNEKIVEGLTSADIWPLLANATKWPTYYANSSDVRFYNGAGPELANGDHFFFKTFGFPVEAQVTEYVAPKNGKPGRIAWHGWAGEPGTKERLDVIHAWLVEDLPNGRVRILTQESQKGEPARKLAASKPNIMINGHQDWLTGLVEAARQAR